mgnify:CR=1 FL=1
MAYAHVVGGTRHVFEDLYATAGTSLADELELVRVEPLTRYLWPDGTRLDLSADLDRTQCGARTPGEDAVDHTLQTTLERLQTHDGARLVGPLRWGRAGCGPRYRRVGRPAAGC